MDTIVWEKSGAGCVSLLALILIYMGWKSWLVFLLSDVFASESN